MDKFTLQQKVKKSIQKCFLLTAAEKDSWLEKLEFLPIEVLKELDQSLQKKNQKTHLYVYEALKNDKNNESLNQVKKILNDGVKSAYQAQEKSEQQSTEKDPEQSLDQQLQNLSQAK